MGSGGGPKGVRRGSAGGRSRRASGGGALLRELEGRLVGPVGDQRVRPARQERLQHPPQPFRSVPDSIQIPSRFHPDVGTRAPFPAATARHKPPPPPAPLPANAAAQTEAGAHMESPYGIVRTCARIRRGCEAFIYTLIQTSFVLPISDITGACTRYGREVTMREGFDDMGGG